MTNKPSSLEDTITTVTDYSRARNFDKNNSAKGLAISLSLEANELLEYFQWQEEPLGTKQDLESELADILIYAIQFANKCNIDIPSSVQSKLQKMEQKYPLEIFHIEDDDERTKAWLHAKQNYKKDTTL